LLLKKMTKQVPNASSEYAAGRRLLRVAAQQTATDSVTLAKQFVAQGKTAQAAGNSVGLSSASAAVSGSSTHPAEGAAPASSLYLTTAASRARNSCWTMHQAQQNQRLELLVLQVAASTAFQRATGAYAMAAADFAAIGDCVKAFQTAADCRRNANMAVQNGASEALHLCGN
jgi:hypothetical protein